MKSYFYSCMKHHGKYSIHKYIVIQEESEIFVLRSHKNLYQTHACWRGSINYPFFINYLILLSPKHFSLLEERNKTLSIPKTSLQILKVQNEKGGEQSAMQKLRKQFYEDSPHKTPLKHHTQWNATLSQCWVG